MWSVPDGEDATGLGKARLLLYTADPLLQDGGYLGRGSLRIGGVASDLLGRGIEDGGGGSGLSQKNESSVLGSAGELPPTTAASSSAPTKLQRIAIGILDGWQELRAMARWTAGAIAAGFDGLTDASLLDAEIAVTRGAARMALENILRSSRGLADSSAIN